MNIVKVLFGNGMLLFLSLFSMVLIVSLIFFRYEFSREISEQNEIYNALEKMKKSPEYRLPLPQVGPPALKRVSSPISQN
ncbi:TPA: hypothetical protein PXP47_003464 [Yersinia enterocolitica]|nr:hypothetical protein [Yersinia enterocolitica]